jgi:hypothetical protein
VTVPGGRDLPPGTHARLREQVLDQIRRTDGPPPSRRRQKLVVGGTLAALLMGGGTVAATAGGLAVWRFDSGVVGVDQNRLDPYYKGKVITRGELQRLQEQGKATISASSVEFGCKGWIPYFDTEAEADADFKAYAERTRSRGRPSPGQVGAGATGDPCARFKDQPGQAADPVEVLRADSSVAMSSGARHWKTLRDVLPNVTYTYEGNGQQSSEQITDSAVVGRITHTAPGRGMLGEPLVTGEDVRSRVVPFDDPRAAWRVLSVTVAVSETLAGTPVDELVLDWYLSGSSERGDDARVVGQALQDLGTVVVMSKAWPDRPEFVPGRAIFELGYGLGRVATNGTLDFPLIARNEAPAAAAFQDGVDTLSELRNLAHQPPRTEPA